MTDCETDEAGEGGGKGTIREVSLAMMGSNHAPVLDVSIELTVSVDGLCLWLYTGLCDPARSLRTTA